MPKKKNPFAGRHAVMHELAKKASERRQHFFYVRIPEPLTAEQRSQKCEVSLTDALGELGEITGGGVVTLLLAT